MHITLKQLNVFIALTQHDTLTAAAQTLCLSKAAVSVSLAELERQLSHRLFDRVNHRLILNQEGKRLLPLADELVSREHALHQLFLEDSTRLQGHLSIGASDTVGNQVVPFLLRDFQAETQHKQQSVFISNTALICQKLVDYELDVGLIEGKTQHEHLIIEPWQQDEMCIVCAPDHPLSQTGQKTLNFEQLENSQWLLREAGSGTREFFLHNVANHINKWHESFELNTTEAIINAAMANLGFACLSRLAANRPLADGRVVELPLPINMTRQFSILRHKEKYQSPLLQQFLMFVREQKDLSCSSYQ